MPSRSRLKTSAAKQGSTLLVRARNAFTQGRLGEAEKLLLEQLGKAPHDFEAMEILAMVRLKQGSTDKAVELLCEVIALSPSSVNAHINLGNVLIAQKRHAEALDVFDTVLRLSPQHIAAQLCHSAMLGALNRTDEALRSYNIVLKLDPDNTDALNNKGTILGGLKRHLEAIACYEQALARKPDFPEALNNLAVSLAAEERNDEALTKYATAIQLRPGYVDAMKNQAELLARMGQNTAALSAYDKVIALLPDVAELHNNQGTVLSALNRHQDALVSYDQALSLKPGYPDALNNRGIALAALNRFEEALQCFRTAAAAQPDYVNAHWNESLTLLRLGRFEEGWQKHEWRWQKPEFEAHKPPFPQPRWQGDEPLAGKTILISAEQGFGDTLQFCRYVSLLETRGAKVVLFVPEPLVALLQSSFPRARVSSKVDHDSACDYWCPLLSLPLAFRTRLDSIPTTTPYLAVDVAYRQKWRQRVALTAGVRRVGIVWTGSTEHKNDINRSLPFAALQALLATPDTHFYSLQKNLGDADRVTLAQLPQVTVLGDELNNFADTAAVIDALDLIVSVDTSVAHLAAALGKPTWILLPFVSDWRWLPGRADSPWYPSARLYWQPGIDQWAPTIARLASDLLAFVPAPIVTSTPKSTAASTAPSTVTLGTEDALRTAQTLLRSGALDDAALICQGVLQLQPNHFDALQLLGAVQLQRNQTDAAISSFGQALNVQPDSAPALANLSGALRLANRHEETYPLYDRAAVLAPDNPSIPTNRAVSFIAQKRYKEALASLAQALVLDPNNIAALNNLGVVYNELRDYDQALESFDHALRIKPDYSDALNNRGLSLIGQNRPDEADRNYQHAISLNANNADAWNNRGLALATLNQVDEALKCFGRAQTLKADYIDALWNESLMNLVKGNFADGWRQYEWRWRKPEFAPHKRQFHVPQWTGKEDITGRTIFLYFEQGFGDTIQFVRYLDLFEAMGAKVILSLPPQLRTLIETSFPNVAVYCGEEVLPPFDYYSPLLSLPLAFGTTLTTIPSRCIYLRAPEAQLGEWAKRLPSSRERKIGLVWCGNPKHQNDRNRSLPLTALGPLLATEGCHFFSLQKEVSADDQALLEKYNVTPLGNTFPDFTATAAAIMQMDLVIAVDTSVAHLAGALGKPLWLLLPFAPDWRWLLNRDDSPWYPTARLFRQPAIGDIDGRVKLVAAALRQWRST